MATKKPRLKKYTILAWNDARIVVQQIAAKGRDDAYSALIELRKDMGTKTPDPRWQLFDGHVAWEVRR